MFQNPGNSSDTLTSAMHPAKAMTDEALDQMRITQVNVTIIEKN